MLEEIARQLRKVRLLVLYCSLGLISERRVADEHRPSHIPRLRACGVMSGSGDRPVKRKLIAAVPTAWEAVIISISM
jgi:hypothetical protein